MDESIYNNLLFKLRMLIPVKRTERSLHAIFQLRSFAEFLPFKATILNVIEPGCDDNIQHFYRDIKDAAAELDADQYKIIIRKGSVFETIIGTAIQSNIDLILLPYAPFSCSIIRNSSYIVRRFIKQCPIPVLFLPDCHSLFPVKRAAVFASRITESYIELSTALRAMRILQAKTNVYVSLENSTKQHISDSIEELKLLNMSAASQANFSFNMVPRHTIPLIQKIKQDINPDLLVFNDINRILPYLSSNYRIIKRTICEAHKPVLLIRKPDITNKLLETYRKKSETISDYELAKTSSDDNIEIGINLNLSGSKLLFGSFSHHGLWKALQQFGIINDLKRMGYTDLHLDIDSHDAFEHRLLLFTSELTHDKPLMDIVIKQQKSLIQPGIPDDFPARHSSFLSVEWLQLQDPYRKFHGQQTLLPGQDYPGLGIGWKVMLFLKLMAERLDFAGLLNAPQFFHTAWFFQRFFHFAAPEHEGQLLAIRRDTFPTQISDLSWAVLHEIVHQIRDNCIESYQWTGSIQILPLTPILKHYFRSSTYKDMINNTLGTYEYRLDTYEIKRLKKNNLFYKMPGD